MCIGNPETKFVKNRPIWGTAKRVREGGRSVDVPNNDSNRICVARNTKFCMCLTNVDHTEGLFDVMPNRPIFRVIPLVFIMSY